MKNRTYIGRFPFEKNYYYTNNNFYNGKEYSEWTLKIVYLYALKNIFYA